MHRTATVSAATFAAAVALAACGGSSTSTTTNSLSTKVPSHSAALKFAQCMRTHGVPHFPDPQSGGGFGFQRAGGPGGGGTVSIDGHQLNVNSQTFQQATQACRKYAPQGPPITGAQLAKIKQGAIKMARCMRAHGVPNFPDPKVTTGPGGHGIGIRIGGPPGSGSSAGSLDPRSPAFQKAQQICQPMMAFGPKAQPAK